MESTAFMLLLLHLESSGTIVFHEGNDKKITRQQVWQSFIQESICSIAAMSNTNIELQDGLKIDDVTKEAFNVLGENGIIRAADQHAFDECTQPYKSTADTFPGVDPAGIVNCTSDLANARGRSFCAFHENQFGVRCRMRNCINEKVS